MRKLASFMPRAFEQREVLRVARAQAVLRHWAAIVGPSLADRSCPERYENGTVWVAVEGSAWAQEMRMMKDRFLRQLNEAAGEPNLFVGMRFGVRPLPDFEIIWAVEEVHVPETPSVPENLTIAEIARRRLENWTD